MVKFKMVRQSMHLLSVFLLALLLSSCAAHILGGGNAQSSGSGQSSNDLAIKSRVTSALVRNKTVDATLIRVRVRRGIVTLSGEVGSSRMRSRAVATARRVRGVRGVRSRFN